MDTVSREGIHLSYENQKQTRRRTGGSQFSVILELTQAARKVKQREKRKKSKDKNS